MRMFGKKKRSQDDYLNMSDIQTIYVLNKLGKWFPWMREVMIYTAETHIEYCQSLVD